MLRPPLRVIVISRIFPNAVEPLSAPFNRQQFAALGRIAEVEILATIPWFPGASVVGRRSDAGRLASVPASATVDGLPVRHPRVLHVPKFGAPIAGMLEAASLTPAVLARRHRVDVVLGSWAYPSGVAAVALARLIGVPAVIKAHGSDLNVLGSIAGARESLSFALPRAARVVTVSRSLADKAISLGARPDRVDVVPNGVDDSIFRVREPAEARRELGIPVDGRMILFCGRIERAKGAFELAEAFTRLVETEKDLSLVMLGDGAARGDLENATRSLGDRVRFVGARPLAEVPVWMAASTLVTLPSWAEGLPNVVREALACGRPVVATRVGGIPELVTSDALGRLVPAKDPAALAKALGEVARGQWNAGDIARASGGSWDHSAELLLASLRRACGPDKEASA